MIIKQTRERNPRWLTNFILAEAADRISDRSLASDMGSIKLAISEGSISDPFAPRLA